jgi:hypothetical protein
MAWRKLGGQAKRTSDSRRQLHSQHPKFSYCDDTLRSFLFNGVSVQYYGANQLALVTTTNEFSMNRRVSGRETRCGRTIMHQHLATISICNSSSKSIRGRGHSQWVTASKAITMLTDWLLLILWAACFKLKAFYPCTKQSRGRQSASYWWMTTRMCVLRFEVYSKATRI